MKFRPTWRLDYCLQSIGARCVLPSYLCYQSLWNWLCISECFDISLSGIRNAYPHRLLWKCIALCLTAPFNDAYICNIALILAFIYYSCGKAHEITKRCSMYFFFFCIRSSQAVSRVFLISTQTWTPSMTSQLQRRTLRAKHREVWTVIQFSGTLTQVLRTHTARPRESQSCSKVTRTLRASLPDKRGPITRTTLPWEESQLRTLKKPGRRSEMAPNHINKWYRQPFPILHHPWVTRHLFHLYLSCITEDNNSSYATCLLPLKLVIADIDT